MGNAGLDSACEKALLPHHKKKMKAFKTHATKAVNCSNLDDCLWRFYRGRLLRVVRSDDEVREILTRYHDNNNHAGRIRAVKEIMVSLNDVMCFT